MLKELVVVRTTVSGNEYHYHATSQNLTDFCIDFLCFLIWPFVESYWLAAVALLSLTPTKPDAPVPQWIDEKTFSNRTQALGKTLYYQGDLVSSVYSPGFIMNSYHRH
jgi:hypothetical protein